MYVFAVIKLIVLPTIAWLMLRNFMAVDSMSFGISVMLLAMPVATNTTMLCTQYETNQELAASTVFITTALSIVTIPLLVKLFFS